MKALWPETYPCSAYRVPCSELDNGYYFSDGLATRVCNAEGDWLPPDYSNCSVRAGVKSFGLVWMTFLTYRGSYVLSQLDSIKKDVSSFTYKWHFIVAYGYVYTCMHTNPHVHIRPFMV